MVRLSLLFFTFCDCASLAYSIKMNEFIDVMALSSFVTMANSFIPIPGASGGTEVVFSLLFSGMMKI